MCTCRHGRCSTLARFTICVVIVRYGDRAASGPHTAAASSGTRSPSGSVPSRPTIVRCPDIGREISCTERRAVSELTHYDPEAGDACVLWCLAIRHAILTGVLDARIGPHHIPAERRDKWAARLDTAGKARPSDFPNNGWVVEALQAAWSAIKTTPIPIDDAAAANIP